jgi:hypothetical protein
MIPLMMAAILGGGLSIVLFGFGLGLCLAPLIGSLAALLMSVLLSLRGM